jgi:hypothetical protein
MAIELNIFAPIRDTPGKDLTIHQGLAAPQVLELRVGTSLSISFCPSSRNLDLAAELLLGAALEP